MTKKSQDPLLEQTIDLFRKQHNSTIARILKRAEDKQTREAKASQREFERTLKSLSRSKMQKTLAKILTSHSRLLKNQPSIRLKAPGTNATSFHFAQTTISKTDIQRREQAGNKSQSGKSGTSGLDLNETKGKKTSQATAHQNYIEREDAVEQDAQSIDRDGNIIKDDPENIIEPELGKQNEQDSKDADKEADDPTKATEPEKDEPTKMPIFGDEMSFGNVAENKKKRSKFWDLFESKYPEDENGNPSYEIIRIPLDQYKSLKRMQEAAAEHIHDDLENNIPVWATIRTPETDKRTKTAHMIILRAKTSLPIEKDPQTQKAEWNLVLASKPSRKNQMEKVRKEIEKTLHKNGSNESLSAPDIQTYIENKDKLSSIHGTTASFGTIGATLEQRQEFWEKTIEEEAINGRVQNRLIVELPHQASPEDHYKIMKRFTEEFRKKNIPFWVAIHQPTQDNDSRNFHAHVVFGDRPAKRIFDETQRKMEWDFAVKKTIVRSNRMTREIRPYKQNKLKEMQARDFIPNMRKKYAETVNQVMAESGIDVRYDPRSYAAMGLNEKPMENINRIISDKMKSKKFIVMDSEWTRRQINLSIKQAAQERSKSWMRIQEVEKNIRDSAVRFQSISRRVNSLPNEIRPSDNQVRKAQHNELMTLERLKLERKRLAQQFANEATIKTLQNIIDATEIDEKKQRSIKISDPTIRISDIERLNLAAKTEMKETIKKIQKEKDRDAQRQKDIESAPRNDEWLDLAAGEPSLTPAQIQERATKIKNRETGKHDEFSPENQTEETEPKQAKIIYSQLTPIPSAVYARMNQMADDLIASGADPETWADILTAQVKASRGMQQMDVTGTAPLSVLEEEPVVASAKARGNAQVFPSPHEKPSPGKKSSYKPRGRQSEQDRSEEKPEADKAPETATRQNQNDQTNTLKKKKKKKRKLNKNWDFDM